MLAFPTFEDPGYLTGEGSRLRISGVNTGSYGVHPEVFLRGIGADELHLTSGKLALEAFARMVAKTAYANAYIEGHLDRVKNSNELVTAMLYQPKSIGQFVGTLPEPYHKRDGVQHYLAIYELEEQRLLCSTVQFFSGSGAPTYIVVLGELK